MNVTDDFRNRYRSLWERMVGHAFVQELGEGTLPLEKFRRYFIQDYLFVGELVKVVSLAIAKAPDLKTGNKLDGFLHVLLTSEDSLFQRVFRELGVAREEYERAQPTPTTRAFGDFLVHLAYEGSFEDILIALYVTEETYLDWASRLVKQGKRPKDTVYQEWIDIHSPDALGEFVAWIKGWLDGAKIEEGRHRLSQIFRTTLRYEYLFWEMAYSGERWPDR